VPETWLSADDASVITERSEHEAWWQVFQNPALTRLFDQVYRQNLNQQIAGLRILEARAQLGIAVGLQYPQSQSFGGWQIRESNDYVGSSTKERMRQRTDWGELLDMPAATELF